MVSRRTRAKGVVCLLLASLAVVVSAPAAQAHPVTVGSFELQLTGETETRSYTAGVDAQMLADSSEDGNTVTVFVNASNGDDWSLGIGAPFPDPLTVGTYTGATPLWSREPGTPGIDFSGNGWGCGSDASGSFVVNAITLGENRYVRTLDVTFVQYCGLSETPVATGHVVIDNPPPPPLLDLGVTINSTGMVDAGGLVTLTGTVACSEATDIELFGQVSQEIRKIVYQGSFFAEFACSPGAPVPWEATSVSDGPFRRGSVEVLASAVGWDSFWGREIRTTQTATVRLRRA